MGKMPAAESSPHNSSNAINRIPLAPRMKKTTRAVSQVMAALKNSKNEAGPTMTEIFKFISSSLFKPATKRQVITALKRGVEFGILKRQKGHYLISEPDELVAKPASVTVKKVKLPVKRTRTLERLDKPAKRLRRSGRKSNPVLVHRCETEYPSPPTMSSIFENVGFD